VRASTGLPAKSEALERLDNGVWFFMFVPEPAIHNVCMGMSDERLVNSLKSIS